MRGVGAKMQERNACMTVHGDKEMPRRGPLRREARDAAAAAASVRLDIEMNKRYSSGFQTPGICQPSQAVASNQDGVQQGETVAEPKAVESYSRGRSPGVPAELHAENSARHHRKVIRQAESGHLPSPETRGR
ncbi:uncharacterized protein LOC134764011 isoform X1 [Penaeus indicus]|uniref:uncharacterized protein LOC134764011 isoform X1 n=1 Tax=Penaeus indicus TaxID=29960 RepID=UPI00300C56CD